MIHAFSIRDYHYSCVNLISSSPLILWFLFMILVNAHTCKPEPHHFELVHVWLPAHANWLHLTYSLGYFLTTLDLHMQIQEPGPWWPCCSWSECVVEAWISDCLSEVPFLPTSWSAHEILILLLVSIFQSFYIVYHTFALLGDLIFLGYYIMPCDNCVLVLLLLECILPLYFRTLILVCTDA